MREHSRGARTIVDTDACFRRPYGAHRSLLIRFATLKRVAK